jgi:tetratricopeptide (TPR) repeat protein
MQKYVKRGIEDEIEKELERKGLACIFGIPGIGKTTTARYVASRMAKKGYIPLVLSFQSFREMRNEDRHVSLRDEDGNEMKLYVIPLEPSIDKKMAQEFASVLINVINEVSEEDKLRSLLKKLRRFCKSTAEKLDEERLLKALACGTMGIASVASEVLWGVSIENLAKILGIIARKDAKLSREVIIVIDDLAEAPISGETLFTIVDFLRRNGAKVLLVRRINLEEEFLRFSEEVERGLVEPRYANELLTGSREIHLLEDERSFPMIIPDFIKFSEIIRENGIKIDDDKMRSLYRLSGGMPALAIIMHRIGVDYRRAREATRMYYSVDRMKERNPTEMAKSTLNTIINSTKRVYKRIARRNFALIAVFAHPVAYDELKELKKKMKEEIEDRGYRFVPNLDESGAIKIFEEEFSGRKRKIYELNEVWAHMRLLLNVLCDMDERTMEEVKMIRENILDIVTSEARESGEFTDRMLLNALENIEWLGRRGYSKLKEGLFWGGEALEHMPTRGLQFRTVIEDLWKKERHCDEILLYAALYAHQLIEWGRSMGLDIGGFRKLIEFTEELMNEKTDDDAVLCSRVMAYSSAAVGLASYGLYEDAEEYLHKAEKVIYSMKELKEVAMFHLYLDRARAESPLENPIKVIESLKKGSEYLERIKMTEAMKRFLRPLREDVREAFRASLDEWYETLYFNFGRAYIYADDMEKARENLRKSLNYAQRAGKIAAMEFLGRIEVIERYIFKWEVEGEEMSFRKLWDICRENFDKIPPEPLASLCAEYLISEMVRGRFDRENLKFIMFNPDIFPIFTGISYILGFMEKSEALEELRKLDLKFFDLILEKAKKSSEIDLEQHKSMREAIEKLYNPSPDIEREEAKKSRIWRRTFYSLQGLARIMMFYIQGDLDCAQELAFSESSEYEIKILKRLFKELGEAIERERKGDEEAREFIKMTFVKLFYLHC